MLKLKIIYDPKYQTKWLTNDDGTTEKYYHSAIKWDTLFTQNNEPKPLIKNLFPYFINKQPGFGLHREKRDIVRPLNLEEYLAIGVLLQFFGDKYNKKKNELITQCSKPKVS